MIGEHVLQYRIVEQLGAGGMGVVYKAEDLRLGRVVALKFLPNALTRDEPSKVRFLREAQAASARIIPISARFTASTRCPMGVCFSRWRTTTARR